MKGNVTRTIELLGRPRTDPSPERAVRGNKVWALFAYLLCARRPVSRERLTSLLFADSEDPMRALRWNLTQLRHLVPELQGLSGAEVQAVPPPDCVVDLLVLKDGTWAGAIALPGLGHELLEGMSFGGSPAFEAWLLNERRLVKATTEAVLREGALSHLAAGDNEKAIELAARLVSIEPLEETYQALLIRSYGAAGDQGAAARQLAACVELFRRELGIEPGEAVTSAIKVGPGSSMTPPVGGRAAVEAQIEAGEAAIKAGVIDAGINSLRRAAVEAHSCGDLGLKARALSVLGSHLAHSGRGPAAHEEGAAALHEVVVLAARLDAPLLISSALREIAWIELLAARYERAEAVLRRARTHAGDDDAEGSRIDFISGMGLAEVARYADSISVLERCIQRARAAEDIRQLGQGLSMLGKTYVLLRDTAKARPLFEEALRIFRAGGWNVLLPWTETYFAEAQLLDGDLEAARDLYVHAYTLALDMGDPCFQSKATAGLGLIAHLEGRSDSALSYLEEARMMLVRTPDHTWTMAWALELLCDVGASTDAPETLRWTHDLESLAGRSGMREMLVRAYLHRARLGDAAAAGTARTLGTEVDNPHLHEVLENLLPV